MSNKIQITGSISEPQSRYTPKQTQVLEFRINAQHSRFNKETSQWEEIGGPFWVSVSLWERDAARWEQTLSQKPRVTVEGVLVIEEFQRRDGAPGVGYQLRSARVLGVIPRRDAAQDATGQAQTSYGTPNTPTPMGGAQNDPWGKDAFNQEPPF